MDLLKKLFFKSKSFSSHISGMCWRDRSITIVGSRKMTRYGEQVVAKLLPPLIEAGVNIVSGFMYGVDQQVHQVCLDYHGFTVAVLGWGIDWEVSPIEKRLYQQIYEQGLLLSEYPKKTSPQLWMFPARDRLMARLSQATLVIEAAAKSGSLITARYAKQFKRPLFSVPGPITSTVSAGTNMLIKSGQAFPVTSATDILALMAWPKIPHQTKGPMFSSNNLLRHLGQEPLSLDELAQKMQINIAKLSAQLSVLQLRGVIEEHRGKFYLRQNVNQD